MSSMPSRGRSIPVSLRNCLLAVVLTATAPGPVAFAAGSGPFCDPETVDAATTALESRPAERFLDSLGVNIHVDQGYDADAYVAPLEYLGVRQVRDGTRNSDAMISLAKATGVRFSLISGGDIDVYMSAARALAKNGALLAIEGPNEPNNFPIEYEGRKGGGSFGWRPVAEYQRDLYAHVKADAVLEKYPVFAPSEVGAETEDVGLQFLTIPAGASTRLPPGTAFADYANAHNYVSGVRGGYHDNQAWNAADPILVGRWDGLAGNNGRTWHKGFAGYPPAVLKTLPRVTTETGWEAGSDPAEQRVQGVVLVNTYLAQFARGWAYTYIYELRDNEGGASLQGLYSGDHPKLAADYIHNLTTILASGAGTPDSSGPSDPRFGADAKTVHALDLAKGGGKHAIAVWGERVSGSDRALLEFPHPRTVQVYDVTEGADPVARQENVRRLCLKTTDHALIVEYDSTQ